MRKRYIILVLCLLTSVFCSYGQTLRSTYFLDNSLYRYRLNPAFAPNADYFGLPIISNTGVGIYSNLGPANVLFPKNGELYTFLNKNVTLDEFMSKLPATPAADLSFDTDLLSFGFYSSKYSYWTVNFGLSVDAGIGISRDFLEFIKSGAPDKSRKYKLDGFNANALASLSASIGYSRELSNLVKGLRIGGALKLYIPAAYMSLDLGDSYLELSDEKWVVNANANGLISSSFFRLVPPKAPGQAPDYTFNTSNIAPAGYGFSIDFGIEYRLSVGSIMDGLSISASVVDLGAQFLSAKYIQTLHSAGNVEYNGFKDIDASKLDQMNFEETLNQLSEDFLALANFEEKVTENGIQILSTPKVYAGVEMPFLNNIMSLGVLYTGKFSYNGRVTNELQLSYSLTPCKWFNLGVSWSFLNNYKSLGWIMEFSPKRGINFYIGSDYMFFDVMPKYYLPVDKIWTDVRFGITFKLGSKYI